MDQNICKGEVLLSIQLCCHESCVDIKLKCWREREVKKLPLETHQIGSKS